MLLLCLYKLIPKNVTHLPRQVLYVFVGWVVISISKLFIGDPLTVFLETSHNDFLRNASIIISLAFHAVVGFSVLRGLRNVKLVEEREDLNTRMLLLRKYDEDWEVRTINQTYRDASHEHHRNPVTFHRTGMIRI